MNAEAGAETDDTPDRAGPGRVDPGQTFKLNQRITSLSVTVALVLVCLKTGAFIASGSIAILASLADSALDLAASLTTFFAVRFAAKPADEDHRFGHGKAEALSSMVQAVLVTLSAIYLVYESVTRLTDPQPIEQGALGVGVMIVSIGMTVGLVWAQTQALKQTASLAVQAQAAAARAHDVAERNPYYPECDLAYQVLALIEEVAARATEGRGGSGTDGRFKLDHGSGQKTG